MLLWVEGGRDAKVDRAEPSQGSLRCRSTVRSSPCLPYGTSMSEPDDDYEWPPGGSSLITAGLFVLLIGGFLILWAWALLGWLDWLL